MPKIRHLLTAFAFLLLLAEAGCSPQAQPAAAEGASRITIVAGGDVMAQREIKRAAASYGREGVPNDGWDGLFAQVRPILEGADVAFCNLETPILDAQSPNDATAVNENEDEFPKFFGPPAMVRSVKAAGFKIVSVANNHAHDMGVGGMEGTQSFLQASALPAAGLTSDGVAQLATVRAGRWTLRFIGATLKMNKNLPAGFTSWDVQQIDPEQTAPLVKLVETTGQPSIVSLHWGKEWGTGPDDAQRVLAHSLCEAGAVMVLGHHAHVAQPVEIYRAKDGRRCVIAWCLGNLVAIEPRHLEANLGMLVRTVLDADAQGRLSVLECAWQPTFALRDGDRIHIVPMDGTDPLAQKARADGVGRSQLASAEKRIGPRAVSAGQ